MSDAHATPVCEATRYEVGRCNGPATFRVVYRTKNGDIADSHVACFRHGLAEVERHHKSAGIARCELEEA